MDVLKALGLMALGVVVHALWALMSPEPWDLDSAYYVLVAQNIARGDGATLSAVWSLGWLPETFPYPADLYWMPLPSRVLIPGTLRGTWGPPAVVVFLTGLIGPLTWLGGRRLGLSEAAALAGGALAATGGFYSRATATTDCYALMAVLGALALALPTRRRWLGLCGVAMLVAWTRSDGFLLAPLLAIGATTWTGRLAVAAAGPLATGLWMTRSLVLAGPSILTMRRSATQLVAYDDFFNGEASGVLTFPDRLALYWEVADVLPGVYLGPALLLLVPFLWFGAYTLRHQPMVRAFAAIYLVAPLVTFALAPLVALHGTLFRTGAFLVGPVSLLVVSGLVAASGPVSRARELHPAFLPGIGVGLFFGLTFVAASIQAQSEIAYLSADPCGETRELPAEARVFTEFPIRMEAACGRIGFIYTETLSATRAATVADRYGICYALVDEGRDIPAFAGWKRSSDHLLRRPDCP